jgi:chaperone modulatory protein CbpM
MTLQQSVVLVGRIVEDEGELSLEQLSSLCEVERQRIVELVDEGVIEARSITELRFGGECLRRARIALRLQRDLGVNVAGVALALQLMERIEELEQRRSVPAGE